jgi:hypothetical protein
MAVDVREERRLTVGPGHHGEIRDVDGNRIGQADDLFRGGAHRGRNPLV